MPKRETRSDLPLNYHAKVAIQHVLSPFRRLPGIDSCYRRCLHHYFPKANGFYSQFGQDRFVANVLYPGKKNGTFLDIGAYDGVSYSNTYFLETQRQWTGLCIEPQPEIFERLRAKRSCVCVNGCAAASNSSAEFVQIQGDDELGMWSGVETSFTPAHRQQVAYLSEHSPDRVRRLNLRCFDINELLEEHKFFRVDYLSIDVEGGESEILKHLDFGRFDIGALTVERGHSDERIIETMTANGYRLIAILGEADGVYVKDARH